MKYVIIVRRKGEVYEDKKFIFDADYIMFIFTYIHSIS